MIVKHLEDVSLPSSDDIIQFETEFKFKLPEDYVAFLKQHNGGVPEPSCVAFTDHFGANIADITYFLSLGSGKDTLQRYLSNYADILPDNVLPIAYDTFGNLVCLLFEDSGSCVVFWNHELDGEDDPVSLFLINTSFTDFCNSLHELVD